MAYNSYKINEECHPNLSCTEKQKIHSDILLTSDRKQDHTYSFSII